MLDHGQGVAAVPVQGVQQRAGVISQPCSLGGCTDPELAGDHAQSLAVAGGVQSALIHGLGDARLQCPQVGCGAVAADQCSEELSCDVQCRVPRRSVGEDDRTQLHAVVQVPERRCLDLTGVVHPGAVGHGGPRAHVELPGRLGQAGGGIQRCHGILHGLYGHRLVQVVPAGTQCLGDAGVDGGPSVVGGEHQVGLVYRGEVQGRQDGATCLACVGGDVCPSVLVRGGDS